MQALNQTETHDQVLSADPAKTAQVALSVFFNIMDAWQVKGKDQMILLGKPAESTFYNWKKGKSGSLSVDTLERISYIMGIYKALGVLFPDRTQADAWVHKPSSHLQGESALAFMLKGSMIHLSDIRRYLDAQRG